MALLQNTAFSILRKGSGGSWRLHKSQEVVEQVSGRAGPLICWYQILRCFHDAKTLPSWEATLIPLTALPAFPLPAPKPSLISPRSPHSTKMIKSYPPSLFPATHPYRRSGFSLCTSLQNVLESDLSGVKCHF